MTVDVVEAAVVPRKRAVRRDKGVAAPEKRRSDEHYARMRLGMWRTKRTRMIVRLLDEGPDLLPSQVEMIKEAVDRVAVVGADSGAEVRGAA